MDHGPEPAELFTLAPSGEGEQPVTPELNSGRLPNGRPFVDLLAPLHLVLGVGVDAMEHEARLFEQVVPAIDALGIDV